MLAGLLFATHDADDRPGQLTATLPFGGTTLVEYQARLVAAVGASQLVVVVGRLTPELIGALGRIARRGITVDSVRSAEEAAAKLHPLARVLMLADGLVTTQEIVDGVAAQADDALLVVEAAHASPRYERLGGGTAWAGIARIDARRIAEVAALPRDYDLQSTTLRLADQARAAHLVLPSGAVADGHGIERGGGALAERGRAVLAATVADRRNWFNAAVIAPIARGLVPRLVARGIGTIAVGAGSAALGVGGILATLFGAPKIGLAAALVAAVGLGLTRVLASLRDEESLGPAATTGQAVVAALVAMALGWSLFVGGSAVAPLLALVAVVAAALVERAATRSRRHRWWGGPPAFLLVTAVCTVAGAPLAGLGVAALYATATLAAAIESLRPPA